MIVLGIPLSWTLKHHVSDVTARAMFMMLLCSSHGPLKFNCPDSFDIKKLGLMSQYCYVIVCIQYSDSCYHTIKQN